ncbi:hypothetical protein E2C01_061609 [Portunus trituberculatus]|uniref:Uncharacterized protein n=1 Tax=Portunus trituberculatus TaxID=210409 RepID=A0A5B7HFJ7_PORTR|nr:hypothetical protein [Portunus trituberculatus]
MLSGRSRLLYLDFGWMWKWPGRAFVQSWCDSSGLAGPLQEMASSAPDDRSSACPGDGEEEQEEEEE